MKNDNTVNVAVAANYSGCLAMSIANGPTTLSNLNGSTLGSHSLKEYVPLIGHENTDRILQKARKIEHLHIVHVSSTFYGGGVSEILTPLTLVMNDIGIETGWRLIQGTPDFFGCTKKLHNALQGATTDISKKEIAIYEEVVSENAMRLHLGDCEAIVVHDPQPLPLVRHLNGTRAKRIWQCHIDLSTPNPAIWKYLSSFVSQYDGAVLSLSEYAQHLRIPQQFIMPAINPFSAKNRELSDNEIDECLALHKIPTDRPLVVQVSRFDKWKDPAGAIEAFRLARQQLDCTLVLVGNNASDDPEGQVVLETILSSADERIVVISVDDPTLVNALQRRAAVVLQKSIREGFGLTVTEAMWKGAAVIGGNVGGIRRQIQDGENGFLVDTVEETAECIIQLLTQPRLRRRLGVNAKETVRRNFLMSRLVEDWIDLLDGHESG